MGIPWYRFCAKYSKEKTWLRTNRRHAGLNAKARPWGRAFSFSLIYLRLAGGVKKSGVEKGLEGAYLPGFEECRYPWG
jgi:hypothetical protein